MFSTIIFLGPCVRKLNYRQGSSQQTQVKSGKGRKRVLLPLEDFFVVLVRFRLGLFEQALAYRFGISQTNASHIIFTWINLLYSQFKQIPLWPTSVLTFSNMPSFFKERYPSTSVIIDATQLFGAQPHLTEL